MRHQKGRTLGSFLALKCLKTFVLYICGIKKAGLWTFFCLEMSENICFIFGIKKAGLRAYFWP